MTDLIRREDAIELIDPDRILPDWVRGYVLQQLKEIPPVELPEPVKRKPGRPRKTASPYDASANPTKDLPGE